MIFEPSDLVLIPFPFSDLAASKKRPVLILTVPDRYDDFVGLAVTSTPMQEAALPLNVADLKIFALEYRFSNRTATTVIPKNKTCSERRHNYL